MPPTEQPPKPWQKANDLAEQKKFNAAFSEFELAIRRNYANAEVHADFGAALLKAGRFPKAIAQFRKAVELDPAGPIDVEQMVEALSHDVRQEQDLEDFQKLVEKADRADLFHNWARVLTKLQRSEQAIEAFASALKKDPEITIDLGSVVQAFKDSNTTEQHIKKFQDEIEKLNNGHAWNTWGGILLGLNRYASAAAQFDNAASVRSDWPAPYINRASALVELADHKQAIEMLRKALKCDEHSVDAYLHLGRALDQIAEYQEAVRNFEVAAEKAPSERYLGPWLDALKKLPDPDPAIVEYEKALDNSSEWRAHLAEFLKQRGRLPESAIQFARSLFFLKVVEAFSQ
jgi:tetratricopeptide (TPR) repeat protein